MALQLMTLQQLFSSTVPAQEVCRKPAPHASQLFATALPPRKSSAIAIRNGDRLTDSAKTNASLSTRKSSRTLPKFILDPRMPHTQCITNDEWSRFLDDYLENYVRQDLTDAENIHNEQLQILSAKQKQSLLSSTLIGKLNRILAKGWPFSGQQQNNIGKQDSKKAASKSGDVYDMGNEVLALDERYWSVSERRFPLTEVKANKLSKHHDKSKPTGNGNQPVTQLARQFVIRIPTDDNMATAANPDHNSAHQRKAVSWRLADYEKWCREDGKKKEWLLKYLRHFSLAIESFDFGPTVDSDSEDDSIIVSSQLQIKEHANQKPTSRGDEPILIPGHAVLSPPDFSESDQYRADILQHRTDSKEGDDVFVVEFREIRSKFVSRPVNTLRDYQRAALDWVQHTMESPLLGSLCPKTSSRIIYVPCRSLLPIMAKIALVLLYLYYRHLLRSKMRGLKRHYSKSFKVLCKHFIVFGMYWRIFNCKDSKVYDLLADCLRLISANQ